MRLRLRHALVWGLGCLALAPHSRAEVGSATLQIMAVIEESIAVDAQPAAGGRAMYLKNLGNSRSAVNIRVLPPKTAGGPGPASASRIATHLVPTNGRELAERGLTLPQTDAADSPTVIEISAP